MRKSIPWLWLSLIGTATLLMAMSQPMLADCSVCTGPTADDVSVQGLLDSVAANGGGSLMLGARVYESCTTWVVGSNTHLRGASRGVTIHRARPGLIGKIVNGTHVGSSIATVGTKNVTITDLTVDHATCGRSSNGISIMPSTIPTTTPATNAVVERVEVFGTPGYHNYFIWNFRGRNVKILNNWVDGNESTLSAQEGIESFGGHDVLISGNTVRNIGGACINLGSADIAETETDGLTVTSNNVRNCNVGVNLGTSNAVFGPQDALATKIIGNTIIGARYSGIEIAPTIGTEVRDVIVSHNTIRDMTGNGSGVVGIRMRANAGPDLGTGISSPTVSNNHIENIRGQNAHAIRITSYPQVRVLDNTMTGVDNGAVFTMDASELRMVGNEIRDGGAAPIQLYASNTAVGFAQFIVESNVVHWSGASPGVLVIGGKTGIVRNNTFRRTDASMPSPVTTVSSCGVAIVGNIAWYNLGWVPTSVPACP